MIVTVFRSRLKPENEQDYFEWAARMAALAKSMPGKGRADFYTAYKLQVCTVRRESLYREQRDGLGGLIVRRCH